jgi:hypothetical protein
MEKTNRKEPTLSTTPMDHECYKVQRDLFIAEYIKFRRGEFNSGPKAIDHLLAMFYVLPATRYFSQDEAAASAYIEHIDNLNATFERYKEEHAGTDFDRGKLIVKPLVKEFDMLVREHFKMMKVCEYSR